MSSITFVTSFIDIYENKEELIKLDARRSIDERIQYFKQLASTGIQIVVYIYDNIEEKIKPIVKEYNNVIYKVIEVKNTFIWKTVNEHNLSMPMNRCTVKDTFEYMTLINCKIEFMKNAIDINPWNSSHFAWIDFAIFYVFKNPDSCKKWLYYLSKLKLNPKFLTFPGCYSSKLNQDDINYILDNVYWRFCGGFLIGDKESIMNFYNLYTFYFPIFLKIYNKIVWEVNFWSWLESFTDWSPTIYIANHNDSILQLSSDFYSENMTFSISNQLKYNYPTYDEYIPTSASFIEYKNLKILNTRYVNYIINNDGCYLIYSPDRILQTQNYLSFLNEELEPLNYIKIDESNVVLTDYLHKAKYFTTKGFEDIRLYVSNDELKFIATTIQYSPLGKNRMVFGNYDIVNQRIHSVNLIEPPNPKTVCEKNWIPIKYRNIIEDCFIYSWNPFQIGRVIEGNTTQPEFTHKLQIIMERKYNHPILSNIRGSSSFVSYDETTLIGLVHYSEEYMPRHYYHVLVQLDKYSLSILKISQPFHFQTLGIEFCIGFTTKINESSEMDFYFWISQMDRDPLFLTIPSNQFNWMDV